MNLAFRKAYLCFMIKRTLELLETKYQLDLAQIFFEEVRIGLYKTAVKLSGERYGLAGTFLPQGDYVYRTKRSTGPMSTGNIIGHSVKTLFEVDDTSIVASLKVATVNALSAAFMGRDYTMIRQKDPIDLLDLTGSKTISIVGAFKGYINRIGRMNHQMHIVEMRPDAIEPAYRQHYIPASQAGSVLPQSDYVLITGSALVNDSLKDLVQFLPKEGKSVLVGPSASILPDVLFEMGFDIIGATRIVDPRKLFQLVSEGGTGFHFFKRCAEKICIVKESRS